MAPLNVTLQSPASLYGASYATRDGTQYTIGPTGLVTIPAIYVSDAVAQGFTVPTIKVSNVIADLSGGPLVAVAGELTGAPSVYAQYSGINGSTLTTRTAAQMIADAGLNVGQSYDLRILNLAAIALTLAAGAGVSFVGKQVIAAGAWTDYVVSVPSAGLMTFTSVGSGTAP